MKEILPFTSEFFQVQKLTYIAKIQAGLAPQWNTKEPNNPTTQQPNNPTTQQPNNSTTQQPNLHFHKNLKSFSEPGSHVPGLLYIYRRQLYYFAYLRITFVNFSFPLKDVWYSVHSCLICNVLHSLLNSNVWIFYMYI